jgi:type IV pilus assembly protein PilB
MHPQNPSTNQNPLSGTENGMNPIVDLLLQEKLVAPKQVEYATRVQTKLDTPRSLLEVLKDLKLIADDEIKKAVRDSRLPMCIGTILVELGYLKSHDLQRALNIQADEKNSRKLGEILLEHHLIDEQVLIEILSLQMGFPLVEPEFSEIDQKLFSRAPAKWYESHAVIPIQKQADGILIAFADPLDGNDLEAVKQIFGDKFVPAIARRNSIKRAVGNCHSGNIKKDLAASDENSIVRLADEILRAAIEREASDIHIEPLKHNMRVRFRQDGVLIHFQDFPPEILPALTNRIKVLKMN